MKDKIKNWGINKELMPLIKSLVKAIIAKDHRKDAIHILTNCTDKTVREFLHFALSKNYNLACTCLDFSIDRKTNKPLMNKSFGIEHLMVDSKLSTVK